jgi:asparagine synthase (glutamine-hydrolysing)
MCGICGIFAVGDSSHLSDWSVIEQMTDTMAHRGPNGRGTWRNRKIALGHRRLAVIDLSNAGRQPMGGEDGSIQIVYNGEVYNFLELKERYKLEERGHVFRSRTDTEVLVHLYEEIGLDMVRELNGMFALAIWDGRKQKLHLVRDRYGIKPLFYQFDQRFFRFGSEIKAILADDRVPRKPSFPALHDFLTFNYIPGEQTAFEGIREVPPAHWMTIDTQGKIAKQRYWDLSFAVDDSIDENSAIEQALKLLDLSVKRRLIADVPIGVMLSGGLDSSVLVALMHRHTSEPIHTYSVGFEDESFNELPYARIVSQAFSTVPHEVVITPELVRELIPKYLTYIDEPYGDGSAIPTYYVCELAKKEVVVVLSGEGGDEAFVGYETYSAYQVSQLFKYIPLWIRENLIAPFVNSLPVSDKKLSLEFKLKRFLGGQDFSPAQAHLWWRIVLTEAQKSMLYTPDLLKQFDSEPSERHFLATFMRATANDDLSRLQYIDSSVFLPDDLMIKNDRMSMAHSLEARVPFTDPELTEFMARVSPRLKLRWLRKKHIMRQAMRGILPPKILNKKKIGLEMPYSRWFKHELKDVLTTWLNPQRIRDRGLFRPEYVQGLIDDHTAGRKDNGRALWGLVNYMMWLDLYIP